LRLLNSITVLLLLLLLSHIVTLHEMLVPMTSQQQRTSFIIQQ